MDCFSSFILAGYKGNQNETDVSDAPAPDDDSNKRWSKKKSLKGTTAFTATLTPPPPDQDCVMMCKLELMYYIINLYVKDSDEIALLLLPLSVVLFSTKKEFPGEQSKKKWSVERAFRMEWNGWRAVVLVC